MKSDDDDDSDGTGVCEDDLELVQYPKTGCAVGDHILQSMTKM